MLRAAAIGCGLALLAMSTIAEAQSAVATPHALPTVTFGVRSRQLDDDRGASAEPSAQCPTIPRRLPLDHQLRWIRAVRRRPIHRLRQVEHAGDRDQPARRAVRERRRNVVGGHRERRPDPPSRRHVRDLHDERRTPASVRPWNYRRRHRPRVGARRRPHRHSGTTDGFCPPMSQSAAPMLASEWDPSIFWGVDERTLYRFARGKLTTRALPAELSRLWEHPLRGGRSGESLVRHCRRPDRKARHSRSRHLPSSETGFERQPRLGPDQDLVVRHRDSRGQIWTMWVDQDFVRHLRLPDDGTRSGGQGSAPLRRSRKQSLADQRSRSVPGSTPRDHDVFTTTRPRRPERLSGLSGS